MTDVVPRMPMRAPPPIRPPAIGAGASSRATGAPLTVTVGSTGGALAEDAPCADRAAAYNAAPPASTCRIAVRRRGRPGLSWQMSFTFCLGNQNQYDNNS